MCWLQALMLFLLLPGNCFIEKSSKFELSITQNVKYASKFSLEDESQFPECGLENGQKLAHWEKFGEY